MLYVSYNTLLFTNFVLVLLTYILEKKWQNSLLLRRTVLYEKIENIKPENHEELLLELNKIGLPSLFFTNKLAKTFSEK